MGILDETEFEEIIKIQNRMAQMVARETEVDDKIKVISIFDELVGAQKKKRVPKEALIIEAVSQGMTEKEVLDLIEKIKSDGIFVESEPGYLQKT